VACRKAIAPEDQGQPPDDTPKARLRGLPEIDAQDRGIQYVTQTAPWRLFQKRNIRPLGQNVAPRGPGVHVQHELNKVGVPS
jgi:hypothetical protein